MNGSFLLARGCGQRPARRRSWGVCGHRCGPGLARRWCRGFGSGGAHLPGACLFVPLSVVVICVLISSIITPGNSGGARSYHCTSTPPDRTSVDDAHKRKKEALSDLSSPMAEPEIIEQPAAAPQPPPGMPPADEPGFLCLPMFGGEIGELFNSLTTGQSMLTVATQLREGVMSSGVAMLGDTSAQAQIATQVATSRGTLKAELVSQGLLQATIENFPLLPILDSTLQLCFVGPMLAGGTLINTLLTPVGRLQAFVNTGGQMSAEFLTGAPTGETSQLMLGAHMWGVPGLMCGYKTALEFQSMNIQGEELLGSTSVTLAVTRPLVDAAGSRLAEVDPTLSLSVFARTSALNSVAASIERHPKNGIHLTAGGTRQLSESSRLRGKWGTQGLLAMALEVAGERSQLSLVTEVSTAGPLNPKFGATLNLSP